MAGRSELETIVRDLISEENGVEVKDRSYHLKTYKQCFLGSELVDWLIENDHCSSRTEAIALGERIREAGFFKHVTDDHELEDAGFFYVFTDQSSTSPPALATSPPSQGQAQSGVSTRVIGELGHSGACLRSMEVFDVCLVCQKHFTDPGRQGITCSACGIAIHVYCQATIEYQCPRSRWSRMREEAMDRVKRASKIASYVNKDALLRAAGSVLEPERSEFYCVMLFADISGYTKLTNKLIEKGEIGVEELSEHLTAYFTLLMTAVEGHGGDIHKICGDAVLNVWRTTEAEAGETIIHVIDCAMKLLEIEYDTGDPETALALHCGIGAGWLSSMLVGGVRGRLEHILLDDRHAPIDQVSTCVDRAKTGDILISAAASKVLSRSSHPGKEKYATEDFGDDGLVKLNLAKMAEAANAAAALVRSQSRQESRDRSGSVVGRIGSIIRGDRSRASSPLAPHRDKDRDAPPAISPRNMSPSLSGAQVAATLVSSESAPSPTNTTNGQHGNGMSSQPQIPGLVLEGSDGDRAVTLIPSFSAASASGPDRGFGGRYTLGEGMTLSDTIVKLWDEGVPPESIGERISPFLPFALRDRVQAGDRWLAELRKASVFFVQMPDLARTSSNDLTKMNRVFTAMQGAIYDQDGGIRQFLQDDKGVILIAMFGVPPHVHEDDATRAISAALSCAERLRVLRVPYRIGITTGRVYAGAVGSVIRREYSVVGAVVNLAARLMTSCGMDDVRCDAATMEGAERDYEFEPMDKIKAKGFKHKIPTFRPLHTRGQSANKVNAEKSAFVGRQNELNVIIAGLQQFSAAFLGHGGGDNMSVIGGPDTGRRQSDVSASASAFGAGLPPGMRSAGAMMVDSAGDASTGAALTRQISVLSAASGASIGGLANREKRMSQKGKGVPPNLNPTAAASLRTHPHLRPGASLGLGQGLGGNSPRNSPRMSATRGRGPGSVAGSLISHHASVQPVFFVEGDPGYGKSRLLGELRKQADTFGITCYISGADSVRSSNLEVWGGFVSQFLFNGSGGDGTGSTRGSVRGSTSLDMPPSPQYASSPLSSKSRLKNKMVDAAHTIIHEADKRRDEAMQYAEELEAAKGVPADRICLLNDVIPGLALQETGAVKRMGAEARGRSTIDLILSILRFEAERRPLLLCIDDAQWMDSLSREMLVAVATRGVGAPVVVASRIAEPRAEEITKILSFRHVRAMKLGGLDPVEVESLAVGRAGATDGSKLPHDLRDLVFDRSQGSPLVVEELVSSLIENGSIVVNDRGVTAYSGNVKSVEEMDMPDSLDALLASRIGRLPPGQEMALKVASVIGKIVPLELIVEVYPEDSLVNVDGTAAHAVKTLLDGLASKGMLECDDTNVTHPVYYFKHSSTLDAAYNTMLYSQRRSLHFAVAECIENANEDNLESQYGVLAHHYLAAKVIDKAFEFLILSGHQSYERYAMKEALKHYEDAIRILHDEDQEIPDGYLHEARIEAHRCDIYISMSKYAESHAAGMRFLDLAGYSKLSLSHAGTIRQMLVAALVQRGFYKKGRKYRPNGLLCSANDPRAPLFKEAASVYLILGQVRFFMLDKIGAIAGAIRGLNIAEQLDSKTPSLARAYSTVAMALLTLKKMPLVSRYRIKVLDTLSDDRAASATGYCKMLLGTIAAQSGDYQNAYEILIEGASVSKSNNEYRHYELCLAQSAICLANWGRVVEAAQVAMKVLESVRVSENKTSNIVGYFYLTWCQVNLGHLEDAVENGERGWAIAQDDDIAAVDKARALALLSLANCWSRVEERVAVAANQAIEAIRLLGVSTVNSSSMTYDAAATTLVSRLEMLRLRPKERNPAKKAEFKRIAAAFKGIVKIMKKFGRAYGCMAPRDWIAEGCYLALVKKDYDGAAALFSESGRFCEKRGMMYDSARSHYLLGRYCLPLDSDTAVPEGARKYVRDGAGGFESQRTRHLRVARDMFEEMECAMYWEKANDVLLGRKGGVFGDRLDGLDDIADEQDLRGMPHGMTRVNTTASHVSHLTAGTDGGYGLTRGAAYREEVLPISLMSDGREE